MKSLIIASVAGAGAIYLMVHSIYGIFVFPAFDAILPVFQ